MLERYALTITKITLQHQRRPGDYRMTHRASMVEDRQFSRGLPTAPSSANLGTRGAEIHGNPSVDLRVVVFTVVDGGLRVALVDADDTPKLPGGPPAPGAGLDAEARRIALLTMGLREQYLEQLYTFSQSRPPGWTLTIAYLALLSPVGQPRVPEGGRWYDLTEVGAASVFDRQVIDYAVLRLRAKISYTTVAFHLMPVTFTLGDLQATYEAVLGHPLDKRNFRRRILAAGFLDPTGTKRREGSHRPALLYRFRSTHDREAYLTPTGVDGHSC